MSKHTRTDKYCNCNRSSDKSILREDKNHSFCQHCGCVIIKNSGGNIFYTLKTKQKRLPLDLSPISLIRHMKKKTEEDYPYINEEFNIEKDDKYMKEKAVKAINVYLKYRKMLLLKLQKLMKTFDYCDMIFYQCLFYLDTILSHEITEEFSEKKILYYLIGYFLVAVKFKETDIYEPSLDSFFDLSKGIYLSMGKIAYYEIICLRSINYNVFSYSAYDWISQLISNGIIFNCEVNGNNEIIIVKGHRHSLVNSINKYAIKLLLSLTAKSIFFKFSPMHIALSLIQIAREKYIDPAMINEKLFFKLINLYGFKQNEYKKCYEEIKAEIKDFNSENEKPTIEKDLVDKIKIVHDSNDNLINLKGERNESTQKPVTEGKNIYVPNKLKSSNAIINIKDNTLLNNNKEEAKTENLLDLEDAKEEKETELTLNEIDSKKKYKLKSKVNNITNIKTNRLSIDCKTHIFESNDNLPFVNLNTKNRLSVISLAAKIDDNKCDTPHDKTISYNKKKNKPILKELKHVRFNEQRYNSIKTNDAHTKNTSNANSIEKERDKEKQNTNKKSKFFSKSNKNIDIFDYNYKNHEESKKKMLTSTKLPVISSFDERVETTIIEQNRNNHNHKTKKHYKLKNTINNLEIKVNMPEEEIKKINHAKKKVEVF